MVDLRTEEGAVRLAEDTQRIVAESMREHGAVAPHAVIVGLRDPKTGRVEEEPFLVPAFVRGAEAGDDVRRALSLGVRRAAIQVRAIGVVVAHEAWVARLRGEDDKRRLEAHLRAGESIETWPDRTEALIVSVEHVAVPGRVWVAEVERDADGNASVGDFRVDELAVPDPVLSNLLPMEAYGPIASA